MFLEKQYKYEEKIMESLDLKHKIKVSVRGNTGWFEIIEFNYEYQKTFVILLKDVIEYYRMSNIELIKQYVTDDDKQYFHNSNIVKIEDNIYEVTTQINKFIDDMVLVLGIKRL